ncbi:hypothetical protein OTB20_08520 [Streptomyces sp. H27-H1]|uniref:hypothetical protein n=1 Tax=Streptomyces sp. H27-H1 TaxID=2996461 RepID=UPI0022711588|nr:hypothetical protein [Streptomyces sp. H27-H1]MCY0926249.1 hypothetical protein [Streptomyces sp. H27-H1]
MSERTREERIEAYYHESAWILVEQLVDAEDTNAELREEIGDEVDGLCTGMHADVAEAHSAWEDVSAERNRYRSAWHSARLRAADAYTYGAEAMDRKAAEIATLSAELRRHRALADEVRQIRGKTMCADTPTELLESHLRPIYAALHELTAADRERRPFVPRIERERAADEYGRLPLRKAPYGAPVLEVMGVDEDGSSVLRLKVAP